MGRGLSKAGVDKDPVISSSLKDPDFRPYFDISEYCKFWKELFNKWIGLLNIYLGRGLLNIYLGRGLSKAGVGSCNMVFLSEPQV